MRRNLVHLLSIVALAGSGCDAPPSPPTGPPTMATSPPSADFDAKHAAARGASPPELTLRVTIKEGRRRFRLGEVIPIELAFSSSEPGKHELAMHEYDRSGRMWSEQFVLSPANGSADPLASYFTHGGGSMGGLAPMPKPLGPDPITIELTLNEWVRFDRPGRHRLFVTSTRTTEVTSNVVELELVDEPSWAAAELARIRARLAEPEHRPAALRELRFLGTNEAAKEIVAQLCAAGERHEHDLHFAAHGQRDRARMIAELQGGLTAPTCAVSKSYLDTLTRLAMAEPPGGAEWGKAHRRARAPFLAALEAATPDKQPRARAVSTHTLLDAKREDEQRAGGTDSATEARRVELARLFETLDEDAQVRILDNEWLTVKTAAMAPTLAKLAADARPRGGRLRSLSDRALERWLELDPPTARGFILDELARPSGARVAFTGTTLGLLPDRELPQLDAALLAGMRAPDADGKPVSDGATLEVRAEVAARYASPAVVEAMWEQYRASTYFRMSLLGYLARNDPAGAKPVIEGLGIDDLHRLAKIEWSDLLQHAVVRRLDDPEPGRGARAAALLEEGANAAALPALWRRLNRLGAPNSASPQRLARALRQAIVQARGWVTLPAELRRLEATCRDEECRRQVRAALDRWPEDNRTVLVLWSHASSGDVSGWLGHYSLRRPQDVLDKLGQLPKGTVLVWGTAEQEVDRGLLAQVRARAAAVGITLERRD